MPQFDLESYATVAERIMQFYEDFPDGTIRTFMVVHNGPEVVFEARIYRSPKEAELGIYTSGWARELEGKTPVNRTSHLENAESSAVGRALANAGYSTSKHHPSREEMIQAAATEDTHGEDIAWLHANASAIPKGAPVVIDGTHHDLRKLIVARWADIKEQPLLARQLATAGQRAIEEVREVAASLNGDPYHA
jgi:hypothetical protein